MKLALRIVAGLFLIALTTMAVVTIFGNAMVASTSSSFGLDSSDALVGLGMAAMMLAGVAGPAVIILVLVAVVRDALQYRERMREYSLSRATR